MMSIPANFGNPNRGVLQTSMMRSTTELRRLVQGAMGELKADLIVSGGKLINVYSGEILDGMEIGVLDGRVCYVGPSAAHGRGPQTQIIDAHGLYVSPGFIDGHTHIGHYCRPYEYLQAYVACGTTALMASGDELATVFGYLGVKLFLDEVAAHPLRVYPLISMVAPQDPLLCSTKSLTQAEVAEGLDDPRVLGLGELVSWLRLTQCDEELLERIAMAHSRRKIIHGHTAGARDQKLCAICAVGISSCHEPIRAEDALERLRLGYWTMLREGSLRRDLAATLKPLLERRINCQRLILVTDSMSPEDAGEIGHMDHVLRQAVSMGLPPVYAIQTVTLNPAMCSGLEQEIGGIAPGRFADLVLLEELESFQVRTTLIGGKIVAAEGRSLVEPKPISLPAQMTDSLRLSPDISPQRFRVPCASSSAKIRVIKLINQTITAETIMTVGASAGVIAANLSDDFLKVAVFERHGNDKRVALGFVKGFGAKLGAVGTTTNLDKNTLLVVGASDEDMAICANALIEGGGGMAIVNRGVVLDKILFPWGGVFSTDPWQEVGQQLRRLHRCLREKGSTFDRPMYALSFLTFVTLPSLRITARGLVDVKERKIVPLFAC
ncbi:MAG TPA: adenine deaminase C-terminal domain-containing protein [Candidatus Binatia bacterium]|nr:adenine deaminase C-terminal domain-containing protein [Candidatus Binatia bacterium]